MSMNELTLGYCDRNPGLETCSSHNDLGAGLVNVENCKISGLRVRLPSEGGKK